MIAAEMEGSAHRRRTVGYVEDVRPRDTGGWRERLPAAPSVEMKNPKDILLRVFHLLPATTYFPTE